MTNHHPDCEDATGAYPGSCTCAAIKRKEAMDTLIAQDADLIDMAGLDGLIERLRSVDVSWSETGEWCAEAADRIEALTAENERLRVQLADLANTINIVGSHYHKAQVALDDLVLDVKKRARAALQKETAETFTRSDNV